MALSDMHAEAVAGIVDRIVARYHRDPTCMVQILREIQEACDWISPEAIDRLQTMLGVPRTKIEGVAGFYSFLYTQPRGKYRVLFSDNITDRMLGNAELMDACVASCGSNPASFPKTAWSASTPPPAPDCATKGPRCWSMVAPSVS